MADRLWKAANFNKQGIHIRLVFLKETGDVQTKDVMYHNNCMNKYISKLPCQELIKMGKFGGRGKIPETFSPSDEIDLCLGRRMNLLNNIDCGFWLGIKISFLLTMGLAFHLLQQ